jgi:hypothetical protein
MGMRTLTMKEEKRHGASDSSLCGNRFTQKEAREQASKPTGEKGG